MQRRKRDGISGLVSGGIGYYEYDDHLGGEERSGFQTTYGFEAGFNIGGVAQITYGPGIDIGFTNWNTNTRVSGN